MNEQEQKAVLAACMMAAFADGSQSDVERAEIKRIAGGFSSQNPNLATIYQEVLLKKFDLAEAARQLPAKELRMLAYEMAVCVCNADGVLTEAERLFLASLRTAFDLETGPEPEIHQAAATLATVPLNVPATLLPVADAELDRSILNYAILNGALEILPHSLSTAAIIPLQMKMVYGIGKRYGFELGPGHVKDFLATVGIGLTSQVLEGFASKVLGGLFGRVGGGLLGGLASQATGSAFAFASTYALGHVAKQYYASGRSLTAAQLKQTFASLLADARSLQPNYASDIAQRSRTIDVNQLVSVCRGS